MDFAAILIIPAASIVTTVLLVAGAILSPRLASLRLAFVVSFVVSIALLTPDVPSEWPMGLLMVALLALWVAAGCIFGGIAGLLVVAAGRKIGLLRRR